MHERAVLAVKVLDGYPCAADQPAQRPPIRRTNAGLLRRGLHLGRERVPEGVHSSHEPTSSGVIADRLSDFVDDPDKAGVRDEDTRPDAIEQLTLRERTGTTLDQHL